MLLSWTIHSKQWGPFGATQFAPHFIQWNLCPSVRDTDQGATSSSHSDSQHGPTTSLSRGLPAHMGTQAQRHRPPCTSGLMDTPADPVIPTPTEGSFPLWSRGGTAGLQGEWVSCPAELQFADCPVLCFLSQVESPPGCSNLSLVSSAGSGKVSECIIKQSQGSPEGRGWGDRESSGSGKLQSHSQNRSYWESDPCKSPLFTIKQQIAQVWRRRALKCKANCPWKGFHPGKPTSLHCHLSYCFEAGAGLLPLPSAR